MIIKKFQANTETEAIELVKEDLGKNAIIMNIKTISPKGIFKIFKKPSVEVTAAIDDSINNYKPEKEYVSPINTSVKHDIFTESSSSIEEKLNSLQELLESQMINNNLNSDKISSDEINDNIKNYSSSKKFEFIQLIYKQLLANEVDDKYVSQIMGEIEKTVKDETPLDVILSNVYQKIVLKLGDAKKITPISNGTKVIFFIGPTGVGKTTTIAKIASSFKLNEKLKIAFINLDTYRIAATQQMMTYAEILGIPLKVVYSPDELETAIKEFESYDLVFVDTAGRSHKTQNLKDDLISYLDKVDSESREVYLVLSITTKYKDLIRIAETYSDITDYSIVFTKFDETLGLGNVLNIKMLTNAPLSYITFGQNVPGDIDRANPQNIAKRLLGEM